MIDGIPAPGPLFFLPKGHYCSQGPVRSRQEQYARKLEAIFGAIDEEGDGQITEERLVEALERPLVPR